MSDTGTHSHADHDHGHGCGHTALRHNGHVDYIHDGELHHQSAGHCEKHVIEVTETNPNTCAPLDICGDHEHGPGCGHEAVPHGDHVDYIVDGRLHHVHNGHCDDHGPVDIIRN